MNFCNADQDKKEARAEDLKSLAHQAAVDHADFVQEIGGLNPENAYNLYRRGFEAGFKKAKELAGRLGERKEGG